MCITKGSYWFLDLRDDSCFDSRWRRESVRVKGWTSADTWFDATSAETCRHEGKMQECSEDAQRERKRRVLPARQAAAVTGGHHLPAGQGLHHPADQQLPADEERPSSRYVSAGTFTNHAQGPASLYARGPFRLQPRRHTHTRTHTLKCYWHVRWCKWRLHSIKTYMWRV